MPKITLNSAAFHGFTFGTAKRGKGSILVVAEFSAPWTEANRKAGDWSELPETISGPVKLLPADLAASHIEFIPGKGLEGHAISMNVSGVTGFQCFIPTKEDEVRELRFSVETADPKAERTLGALGRIALNATGKLKISYEAAPEEAPLISAEQAADTAAE